MKNDFILKSWYLSRYGSKHQVINGKVYGNKKFVDGRNITTSSITDIQCHGDSLLITTRKSVYKCEFSEYAGSNEGLDILVDEFNVSDDIVSDILKLSEGKRERRIEELTKMITPSENFLIMCFDGDAECWEDVYIIKNKNYDVPVMKDYYISTGMFHDTVNISELKISYSPDIDGPNFERFAVPDDLDVYFYNSGPSSFIIKGKIFEPEEFMLHPEVIRKVEFCKNHVPNKETIEPIDTL